jgi:hypothetical protein
MNYYDFCKFLLFSLFPTGLINLGFITEGKLIAVLITPSLGDPNWSVIYIINTAPPTAKSEFSAYILSIKNL